MEKKLAKKTEAEMAAASLCAQVENGELIEVDAITSQPFLVTPTTTSEKIK